MNSGYPISFEVDYEERRSRLTTLLRVILAIPHFILLYLWAIIGFFAVVVAWFALLITGSYPAGLYGFVSGLMRYATRVNAYLYLLTDAYPPFDGGEDPQYPVRLRIAPPQSEYNRLKVLLRIFYIIPAYILQYVLNLLAYVIAFVSWIVIVITGRQPQGLQDLIRLGVSYYARSMGLFTLVTETYPPISDEQPSLTTGAPAPGAIN
jgi:hypothetical protein